MSSTALISGAGGGIGRATARLFLQNGWQVIGIDTSEPDPSWDEPRLRGSIYRFVQADLSSEEQTREVFRLLEREYRIDALINNAATSLSKTLVNTTLEEWDGILANNLRSVYLTVKNAYPLMKDRGGAIVNVSSVHAIATATHNAAYSSSKGALVALTRALALEFAQARIRVNAVLPGAIDTPMLRRNLEAKSARGVEDSLDELAARHPLKRIGRPDEVAQAILFLSDDQKASFITGQALIVDGGAIAQLSTE